MGTAGASRRRTMKDPTLRRFTLADNTILVAAAGVGAMPWRFFHEHRSVLPPGVMVSRSWAWSLDVAPCALAAALGLPAVGWRPACLGAE